jgi:hypothetical protein
MQTTTNDAVMEQCACGIDPSLSGTGVSFWPENVTYRLEA